MRRFLIAISVILVMVSTLFLSSCSLGEDSRENELKDILKTTYEELNTTFSGDDGKYPLVAEYLYSWAKKNDLEVAENHSNYMVIVNPATKGYEKKESTVIQCAVQTAAMDSSMQPLAVSLTSLLGPETHGKITLIVTEDADGNYAGAEAVDPKYYKCDNFINMQYNSETSLLTTGCDTLTSTMTSELSMTAPSYSKAFAITMSMSAYSDPFEFEKHYPNPIETIGSLLATEKSSGKLFQLASFNCKYTKGYTPLSATAIVVVDENSVESFTKKFDKSYESIKKKFDKLEDHFVYTMTETSMPETVISNHDSDHIISLMYTLKSGIYLQDEDTGEIISASDISYINTNNKRLIVTLDSRSLDKNVLNEMSSAYATTSGLCDIKYAASTPGYTWSADTNKDLASFFQKALSFDDPKKLKTMTSSECDIFASKVPGLNIISYRFNSDNREAAFTNMFNFLESRTAE